MPRTTKDRTKSGPELSCPVCAEVISGRERKRWRHGPDYKPLPVVHCEGSRAAYGCSVFEPHHVSEKRPPCWKCGAAMGCQVCVEADPVCTRCVVKTSRTGFIENGPISNDRFSIRARDGKIAPGVDAYAQEWQRAYQQESSTPASLSDDDLYDQWKAAEAKAGRAAAKAMPANATRSALQGERNRQVAALARRQPGED